jgi:hypothetical protein
MSAGEIPKMKAFLSHSSRDKGVVGQVFDLLGEANAELDSATFDQGVLNVVAIQESLKRCSLFVLFLSHAALASNVVHYEALQAQDLVARGLIDRFLVVCLDEEAFASAEAQWKGFNFVRRAVAPQSIARQVQSLLAISRAKTKSDAQPFVGRSVELHNAKEQLSAPGRDAGALYISGNSGIGRRTFARRLFKDTYPAVNQVFPELQLESIDGSFEIYRKLNELITPLAPLSAYRARIMGFTIAKENERTELIAQLLNNLLDAREALFLNDYGGLLGEEGRLRPLIKSIVEKVTRRIHPPVVMIAERMIPRRFRGELKEVVSVAF